jgi:hypothetical protein
LVSPELPEHIDSEILARAGSFTTRLISLTICENDMEDLLKLGSREFNWDIGDRVAAALT